MSRVPRTRAAGPLDGAWVGRATFAGWIVLVEAPRRDVGALVPGLSLPLAAPADTHPVVFVFGQLARTAVRVAGVWAPAGRGFRELGVYVPGVQLVAGDPTAHLCVARIWSSDQRSRWSGNFHFGMPKRLGRMWWQGDEFLVTEADGTLAAHAAVRPDAASGNAGDVLAQVRCLFAQPALGRRLDGRPVRFGFRWRVPATPPRPGAAAITLLDSRPAGAGTLRFASEPGRAVQVDGLVWEIGWPG